MSLQALNGFSWHVFVILMETDGVIFRCYLPHYWIICLMQELTIIYGVEHRRGLRHCF